MLPLLLSEEESLSFVQKHVRDVVSHHSFYEHPLSIFNDYGFTLSNAVRFGLESENESKYVFIEFFNSNGYWADGVFEKLKKSLFRYDDLEDFPFANTHFCTDPNNKISSTIPKRDYIILSPFNLPCSKEVVLFCTKLF